MRIIYMLKCAEICARKKVPVADAPWGPFPCARMKNACMHAYCMRTRVGKITQTWAFRTRICTHHAYATILRGDVPRKGPNLLMPFFSTRACACITLFCADRHH